MLSESVPENTSFGESWSKSIDRKFEKVAKLCRRFTTKCVVSASAPFYTLCIYIS